MAKNKLYIIEGAQGAGKTTISRLIRENKTYTVLVSLSGTSDKTLAGEEKVFKEHWASLRMVDDCKGCDLNFVWDRSFLTERNYCLLGYKEYSFSRNYNSLLAYLKHIADDYDVHLILLTASPDELATRLKRDKPQFLDVAFNVQNSINQQETYIHMLKDIKRECPNINCTTYDTNGKDPYDIVYDIIEGSK